MKETHFHQELDSLKKRLFEMGFRVEEGIVKACESLLDHDAEKAQEVLEDEKIINSLELEIDDRGHALFALGQPMAIDLRLMTMILKINADLERMGDHAVNIAEKASSIMKEPELKGICDLIETMASAAQKMVREALDAFLKEDVELAQSVLVQDDEVDHYNERCYLRLRGLMEAQPDTVGAAMNFMLVSHNLERIADLASNIAEDTIYWKQGREVRHRVEM